MPGRCRGGQAAGDQAPHPGPRLRSRVVDPFQRGRGQLVQGPPHRRWRGDRTQHVLLMAQRVDVGDGLTAGGDHRRDVDQDPAAVMTGSEPVPSQRRRQGTGQPRSVGKHPHRHAARMSNHAGPIPGHRQPRRPRCTLHLPGAFPLEKLDCRKYKYPVAGQALWCIPRVCQPINRERPRLPEADAAARSTVGAGRLPWPGLTHEIRRVRWLPAGRGCRVSSDPIAQNHCHRPTNPIAQPTPTGR